MVSGIISYVSPAAEVVDTSSYGVLCSSYEYGGEGMKFDNNWDDILFFGED